ncbi:MAG: T9SS type A sorting domain-containing protein [Bacteroidales bacterium]|jgi:hypothetical protein
MKKITFLVAVLMLTVSMAFSQINSMHFTKAKAISAQTALMKLNNGVKTTVCDTTLPVSFTTGSCLDSITCFYTCKTCTTPDSGFVTGNNYYGFTAIAENYKGVATGTVSDVIVFYSYATISGTGNTSASIYAITGGHANGTDGLPTGTALGTSAVITLANIDTTNFGFNFSNDYHFSTPVSAASKFAVAINLPTWVHSTCVVGIWDEGTGAPNSCATLDTAGTFKYSTWRDYSSTTNGFGLYVDPAIFPVICVTAVGVENYTPNDVINLYPNPSNSEVNIFSSNNMENIQIVNAIGQTVYNNKVGANYTKINTSDFNSGVYFVRIKCKNGITTKSLQVVR